MQGKRHDRVVEMRLCFFSGKVGDYKVPFKSTRKCRSTDYHLSINCYVEHLKSSRYLSKALEAMKKDPVRCKSELALLLHHHIQLFSDAFQKHQEKESPALAMKSFIEKNINQAVSIDDIAACAHLSRSRANYVFKREYQMAPYHYYQSLRLEVSMNLLRESSMTIQEISNHLGFSDYHHFTAFFKKWCGMPPTRYRLVNRGKNSID